MTIDISKFNLTETIKVNPKYMALLSQKFVYDGRVLRKGGWAAFMVVAGDGTVVHYHEVPSVILTRDVANITFTTSHRRPFTAFVILSWYYPGIGVFSKRFRMGINYTPSSQGLVIGKYPSDPSVYSSLRRRAEASLRRAVKRSRRLSATALRPNPEVRTETGPANYYFNGTWALGSYSQEVYRRTWSGTRTPNFRSKAKRELPVNGHTSQIAQVHANTIIRHKEDSNWSTPEEYIDTVWRWYPMPPPYFGFQQVGRDRALSRLRDKMGADTANLAQDIGEIRETIRMIVKVFQRIHHANTQLRTGNIPGAINALWSGRSQGNAPSRGLRGWAKAGKTAKSIAKATAENWLELQYGWKPLLNDIHDSLEKSSRLFNKPGPFIVATAKGSAKTKFMWDQQIESSYAPYLGFNAGKFTRQWSQWDKMGVRYKISDAHVAFLAQTGFTNPVNLVWELLPYSFVVDWVLPIGPWLESFTAFQGLEFHDGYTTQFTRIEDTMTIDSSGSAGPPNYSNIQWFEKGLGWRTTVSLDRKKLTAFPLANFPSVKSPWSTRHALNALALLVVGFREGARWHS